MREVQYIADDGKPFPTEYACRLHDLELLMAATRATWAQPEGELGGCVGSARFVYLPDDASVVQFEAIADIEASCSPREAGTWMYNDDTDEWESLDVVTNNLEERLADLRLIRIKLIAESDAKLAKQVLKDHNV